ncbi:unnamed protein product, partial [Amoebophrya sp. A120]
AEDDDSFLLLLFVVQPATQFTIKIMSGFSNQNNLSEPLLPRGAPPVEPTNSSRNPSPTTIPSTAPLPPPRSSKNAIVRSAEVPGMVAGWMQQRRNRLQNQHEERNFAKRVRRAAQLARQESTASASTGFAGFSRANSMQPGGQFLSGAFGSGGSEQLSSGLYSLERDGNSSTATPSASQQLLLAAAASASRSGTRELFQQQLSASDRLRRAVKATQAVSAFRSVVGNSSNAALASTSSNRVGGPARVPRPEGETASDGPQASSLSQPLLSPRTLQATNTQLDQVRLDSDFLPPRPSYLDDLNLFVGRPSTTSLLSSGSKTTGSNYRGGNEVVQEFATERRHDNGELELPLLSKTTNGSAKLHNNENEDERDLQSAGQLEVEPRFPSQIQQQQGNIPQERVRQFSFRSLSKSSVVSSLALDEEWYLRIGNSWSSWLAYLVQEGFYYAFLVFVICIWVVVALFLFCWENSSYGAFGGSDPCVAVLQDVTRWDGNGSNPQEEGHAPAFMMARDDLPDVMWGGDEHQQEAGDYAWLQSSYGRQDGIGDQATTRPGAAADDFLYKNGCPRSRPIRLQPERLTASDWFFHSGPRHISFMDCLYMGISLATNTGLQSFQWAAFSPLSHVIALLTMILASTPMLALFPPLLRRYDFRKQHKIWLRKHLEHIDSLLRVVLHEEEQQGQDRTDPRPPQLPDEVARKEQVDLHLGTSLAGKTRETKTTPTVLQKEILLEDEEKKAAKDEDLDDMEFAMESARKQMLAGAKEAELILTPSRSKNNPSNQNENLRADGPEDPATLIPVVNGLSFSAAASSSTSQTRNNSATTPAKNIAASEGEATMMSPVLVISGSGAHENVNVAERHTTNQASAGLLVRENDRGSGTTAAAGTSSAPVSETGSGLRKEPQVPSPSVINLVDAATTDPVLATPSSMSRPPLSADPAKISTNSTDEEQIALSSMDGSLNTGTSHANSAAIGDTGDNASQGTASVALGGGGSVG